MLYQSSGTIITAILMSKFMSLVGQLFNSDVILDTIDGKGGNSYIIF